MTTGGPELHDGTEGAAHPAPSDAHPQRSDPAAPAPEEPPDNAPPVPLTSEAQADGGGSADATSSHNRRQEKAWLLRWLHPEGIDWGANVADFDPAKVEEARRWMGVFFGPRRYFRVEVDGWDHLPPSPVMVVSNHSGGSLFLDTWGLGWAWYSHFGTDRPIHPAAHEMLLGNRLTGPFMAQRGVVRADKRLAKRVLTHWNEDLLVMPGGDLDVWRPFKKRYEVQFAGRKGYARLALEAHVPVVPVVNAGAHHTLIVLSDGRRMAEALHLPELVRAHIWPVHLSLPWGLAIGPWPHLPTPARLRYRFAPAIHPSIVGAERGVPPTHEQVEAFDAAIRAAMQRELDVLRASRFER